MTVNKKKEIDKFEPKALVELLENHGNHIDFNLEIKDEIYLQKKQLHTYSPNYSDGDIEFWIETYKVRYYGGSWQKVDKFIKLCNNIFGLEIETTPNYNGMVRFVKKFFGQNNLNYKEFYNEYGDYKAIITPSDGEILEWIKIYQDRDKGGSISAIIRELENTQGYSRGETTLRRYIRNFFSEGKYKDHFDDDLAYREWIKIYKRKYFRENIPLDSKTQSHEYILQHNIRNNEYKRIFIKDLENPNLSENIEELEIFGISNDLQPNELKINHIEKNQPQESLEIVCKHGSVIITPDQYLFTIDDNCNLIEVNACNLKVDMPILIPRLLEVELNEHLLDLKNCGKIIINNNYQFIKQYKTIGYRYIEKIPDLGIIIGQYIAEGTFPSKYQPQTTISVSVNEQHIQELQEIGKGIFGLDFRIITKRIEKCKACGSETIEDGEYNICPNCDGRYQEYFELITKTKLAKTIFTEGLGIEHAYSYLKELPPFLYNAPTECEQSFISSYFRGDGSERDYRNKGGSFDLNFETSSRRLVFGLNFLMKKLGVIMSVNEHEPPPNRPNSKLMYSMIIRGSSNFEIFNSYFDKLPEIDYTKSDIKPSVNTQILLRKLNLELQKEYCVSLRDLYRNGFVPKGAVNIATQIKRKTNLSEVLLLKTLDGLKKSGNMTSLANRMEQVFRKNSFTKIKDIKPKKNCSDTYKISVDGLGYCSGTVFAYVKSEPYTKSLDTEPCLIDVLDDFNYRNSDYNLGCKREKFRK